MGGIWKYSLDSRNRNANLKLSLNDLKELNKLKVIIFQIRRFWGEIKDENHIWKRKRSEEGSMNTEIEGKRKWEWERGRTNTLLTLHLTQIFPPDLSASVGQGADLGSRQIYPHFFLSTPSNRLILQGFIWLSSASSFLFSSFLNVHSRIYGWNCQTAGPWE